MLLTAGQAAGMKIKIKIIQIKLPRMKRQNDHKRTKSIASEISPEYPGDNPIIVLS